MTIVAIFSGRYCNGDAVARDLSERTGYRLITDDLIVGNAAELSGLPKDKIFRCFTSKTSVFNEFTHEKEFAIACLRLALAHEIKKGPVIVHGFSSLLISHTIGHLLRVCIIAEMPYRIQQALTTKALTPAAAQKNIQTMDVACAAWTRLIFSENDPWSDTLYDTVLSTNRLDIAKSVEKIRERTLHDSVRRTSASLQSEKDFLLSATVEMALCRAGHDVSVDVQAGRVTLTTNKHVLMLARLESELAAIASAIPGVRSVTTQVDDSKCSEKIYRKHSPDLPSRVLLVDDEREFVQTLSERLQLRNMGAAVAFDGQSALNLVKEDEPEVMLLDLKMPGLDGMEILQRVKSTRPEIEVIVLTGHGNDRDMERCMQLGAFAYMQKPVDIDQLSMILRKAHEKVQQIQG